MRDIYPNMPVSSLLCTAPLLLANCMLIAAYLLELATHAQLHSYDIHTPGPFTTGMKVEIVVGYLSNSLLLSSSNRFLRQAICRTAPRFHLHKDQIMLILGDDIDLSVPTAEIALQNTIALADQRFCRQAFSRATKPLTRSLNWFGFIDGIVYQLSPTISYVAQCASVVISPSARLVPVALYPSTIEQSGVGSFLLCCLLVTSMSCTGHLIPQ